MTEENYVPPLKAIRKMCLECLGGSTEDVKNCTAKTCPIYHYRFGKNPFKKREYTDKQREDMKNRFNKNLGRE